VIERGSIEIADTRSFHFFLPSFLDATYAFFVTILFVRLLFSLGHLFPSRYFSNNLTCTIPTLWKYIIYPLLLSSLSNMDELYVKDGW